MIKQASEFKGDNFSGGLVTSADPFKLDDNQSPNCMNVYSDIYKDVLSRKGYTAINSSAASGTCFGLYDFQVRDGDRKLMAHIGTVLYKMENLDGTLDSFQTGLPTEETFFTELNNVLIFKSRQASSGYYWDGITASPTSIVQLSPKANELIQWNQHIFYWTRDESNKLKYSEYNSYLEYPSDNYYYTSDGEHIKALQTLRGKMFLLKEDGIDRVTYLGGVPLLEVRGTVTGIGTTAAKAIQKAHTRQYGEVLIFPTSDNRIVLFNGSEVKQISDPIDLPNGECPFKLSDLSDAHATVDPTKGWYICWFGDYAIVYDYNLNSWWPFDNQGFDASTFSHTPDGNKYVITAKDGFIYKWFYGNTDDGDAINAYWCSKHIGTGKLAKSHKLVFGYRTAGDFNMYAQHRCDYTQAFSEAVNMPRYAKDHNTFLGTSFVLGESALGGKTQRDFEIDPRQSFEYIQYKVGQSVVAPPFRLKYGQLVESVKGYA